ncbi:MAG: hypothetical protein KH846_09650, partial [Leptotrichia wadei]|uniref:YjcQ family protein n=1 Tax=Leptotrichia wadei TaxID=157687 RepID=UPI0026F0241B
MSLDTTIFRILKAIDVAYEENNFNFDETLNLKKLGISERRLILMLEQLKEKNYITGISIFMTSVVIAIASISNDNLQDLKTGQLVGA